MKKSIFLVSIALLTITLISCASTEKPKKEKKHKAPNEQNEEFFGSAFKSDMKEIEEYEFSGEEEYFIGRTVAASVINKYPVYDDPAATFYVNQVLQSLVYDGDVRAVYNGYHAVILDTTEINAFATPGGHIFITKGLFEAAGSEDALAAILAHELAHVQNQHGLETIRADRAGKVVQRETGAIAKKLSGSIMEAIIEDKLEESFGGIPFLGKPIAKATSKAITNTVMEGGLIESLGNAVSNACDALFISGYSKQDEFEADETALEFLYSAGYNVYAMQDMLNMMDELERKQKITTGVFSTHPKPKTRLKKIKPKLKKYPETKTDPVRTKRYNEVK